MPEVRLEETARGPALVRGDLRVSVHLNKGTFAIEGAGVSLRDAAGSLRLAGGPAFTTRGTGLTFEGEQRADDDHGRGLSLLLARETDEGEPELMVTITLYEDHPFAVIQMDAENRKAAPLRIAAFHVLDGAVLDLGSPVEGWRWYKEGWQSWSPALPLPVSIADLPMAPPVIAPRTQPEEAPDRFLSELVTAVCDPSSGSSMVAGFISAADQFSQLWLDRETRSLTAASYADGLALRQREHIVSERLCIAFPADANAGLAAYGDAISREMRAISWPQPVSGWCSWYQYFQGVTEDAVLENLEYLTHHRRDLPFEYVQVDDGYQAGIGDWLTPNDKFPHGMGWLAERIHEAGFKAGLWLAPFLMGEKSQLWQEHPDWAVQYEAGKPYICMLNWEQRCYGMDLTHPGAQEWLASVFRTIFEDWGYDYVKIDFVYGGALDGIRHDANVTRAQAYRRGLEIIREIAGERFILGCGNPVGPSIGLVNGARVSPDVAPFWQPLETPVDADRGRSDLSTVATANALRNDLNRFWMHNRLWLNDPDCLMVRETETALDEEEVRALTTVIAMTGGMVLDSDRLPGLSEERREIISMLLPVYGRCGVPLDGFESGMPQRFELDCGTHRMLALFNWGEVIGSVESPLPAGEWHVFDAWRREYLGRHSGRLSLMTARHGCRLVRLTPVRGQPQVIGTSFHLLQGAVEIADEKLMGEHLRVVLRPVAKIEGQVYAWTPDGVRTWLGRVDAEMTISLGYLSEDS